MAKDPYSTPARFQFWINELGPLLAIAAAKRERELGHKWTLTDEARYRLEQSFIDEGVDLEDARAKWQERQVSNND